MSGIVQFLDPQGSAMKEQAEKDSALANRIAPRSAQELEREEDIKAAYRLGLSFGLEPHEVETALLNAMKQKRLNETSARIHGALDKGIRK